MSNSINHPEAWKFYISEARNIIEEDDINKLGNYRIPLPDKSGNFIYAKSVEELWSRFIFSWYNIESLNAPTTRGIIQYIVKKF